jgi:hypothetical protein
MAKDPVTVEPGGTANVLVSFAAQDAQDAADKVRTWVLHSGCAMSLSFTQAARPIETDSGGLPGLVEPPPEAQPTEAGADRAV